MKRHLIALIVAAMAALVACGGGSGPTPVTTCQDSKASNFNGALPCVFPAPVTTANIISTTPAAGSTMVVGQRVAVNISYTALELPATVSVEFYDVNKNLIPGASTGANLTSSGVVTLQAGAGVVGHSQYIRVEFTPPSNGNVVYFSKDFEVPFDWK